MPLRHAAAIIALLALLNGCGRPAVFIPAEPMTAQDGAEADLLTYDVDGDGKADVGFNNPRRAEGGRIHEMAMLRTGSRDATQVVNLDAIPVDQCRHLVIVLDGFGYDVVREFYEHGGLRMFHPPSKLLAPYPSMSDLSLGDAFAYLPADGVEAIYYSHVTNELAGSTWTYLAGANMPYNALLDYRGDLITDAVAYIVPGWGWGRELNQAKRAYDEDGSREFIAYFVTSAGVSTIEGAAGQRQVLEDVDRLVKQVLWESSGLTKVTMFSDHGHSYTPAQRIELEEFLQQRGWNIAETLKSPQDVVYARFGLVTYVGLATRRPAALAAEVTEATGVDVVSYADGQNVVVLAPGGEKAEVVRKGTADRYAYRPIKGDPLQLRDVLTELEPDADGFYDAEALLAATIDHVYPAPLQRLWRGHFTMVKHPPDVLVSLKDEYYSGAGGLDIFANVVSTHGSLNRANSMAFIMSTVGPLPPYMRSRDIAGHMDVFTGAGWPWKEYATDDD